MEFINTTYDYLTSNPYMAVGVFCILLFFIIRLMIYLMYFSLITGFEKGIKIIDGKIDDGQSLTIDQTDDGNPIVKLSQNQKHGSEFTYSFWLKINPEIIGTDDYDISACVGYCDYTVGGKWPDSVDRASCGAGEDIAHVFSKGDYISEINGKSSTTWADCLNTGNSGDINSNLNEGIGNTKGGQLFSNGILKENNGPGVYLANIGPDASANTEIALIIFMDTTQHPGYNLEPIIIKKMPIQKWVNVIITVKSNYMYVYINGSLKKTNQYIDGSGNQMHFKQNYDNIEINKNKIKWGILADLVYYPRSVNGYEISKIVQSKPNTSNSKIKGSEIAEEFPNYLSSSFYDD